MIMEEHGYLCDFSLPLERFLEALALVEGHEVVDAHVDFLDALLSREVDTPSDRDSFYLYHLRSPLFYDVEGGFQACQYVRLILAIH